MSHTEIELPWVEKYRPNKLEDVIGHEQITARLKSYVEKRNLPNMLFSGPAGTGKTSSAIALAKELFGKGYEQNFLELNASDERGIDTVRNTIKDFARTLAFDSDFKIIFLDECDALTQDAQQALRRTMEKYTKTCRFILSCVTPETKLMLPEETEITMNDFLKLYENRKISLVASKAGKNIVIEQAICFTEQDPKITGKKVLQITTDTGRTLSATTDHLLLTEKGWRKTGELLPGEKVIIYPSLEGTRYEIRNENIFNVLDFEEYYEKEIGFTHREKNCFANLLAKEKKALLLEIKEAIPKLPCGLTKREMDAYNIAKNSNRRLTRKEIQFKMGLSRIRTIQILKKIEEKGFIRREIKGKTHIFQITEKIPAQIRNLKDIVRLISKQKGIKISYSNIKNHIEKKTFFANSFEKFSAQLKEKNLLDITYSDQRAGAFARIFGFIYGDAHITKDTHSIIFTGNENALKEVKKDLFTLGFTGTEIKSKYIESEIQGRKISGHTTSFKLNSTGFTNLLLFLGAPKGDKIITKYSIPQWIMTGTKFVKREFIRSLFGCEAYSPKIKNKNFEEINLRMHKAIHLNENMLGFFEQIKNILFEFEVKSKISIIQTEYKRKDGIKTNIYALHLDSSNENLFNFLTKIGYVYEKEKNTKARFGGEYLRQKLNEIKNRALIGAQATSMIGIKSKRAISRELNCSVDFVISQSKGKKTKLHRAFPNYLEWLKEHDAGNGFIFCKITQIKETDAQKVMDLTCVNNHNFIANGFVAHNCNYSSKVLEPIQSRCVIYRFKPLGAKDIEKQVKQIAEKEKIHVEEKAINALNYVSQGDLRKTLNVLQAATTLDKKITEETIYSVASRARPEQIQEMILLALKGKFIEARKKLEELMYEQGMSGEDIIMQLYRETMNMEEKELSDKHKIELVDTIGEYDFRIVEGANERIQLEALLAQYMKYKK